MRETRNIPESEATENLIAALKKAGLTIAIAESLTGGMVLAELTRVPTASTVVSGGIVAYATELKRDLLGVSPALLTRRGPVHPDVAMQMAVGVRAACAIDGKPADIGLATTGVAGPSPQSGCDPGTVFIGLAHGNNVQCSSLFLSGTRDLIRLNTVHESIRILNDALVERVFTGDHK